MAQSRRMSMLEAATGTAAGLVIGFLMNLYMLPLYGFATTGNQALSLTIIFSVVGMARSYIWRRMFNLWR